MHPLIANLGQAHRLRVQAWGLASPCATPETMVQIARAAETAAPPPSAAGPVRTFAIKGRRRARDRPVGKRKATRAYITPRCATPAPVAAPPRHRRLDVTAARASRHGLSFAWRPLRPCVKTAPSSWLTAVPSNAQRRRRRRWTSPSTTGRPLRVTVPHRRPRPERCARSLPRSRIVTQAVCARQAGGNENGTKTRCA